MKILTLKEEAFCQLYLKQGGDAFGNASKAYRGAYNVGKKTKASTVHRQACDLMQRPHVAARLEELRLATAKEAHFGATELYQYWVDILTADPNELVQNRRNCCRFCHGINHQRQWSEVEFTLVWTKAIEEERTKLPEAIGGFGYHPDNPPNPNCPVCFGRGIVETIVADTRKLKGKAKLLYAGIKQKRAGPEVVMHNQTQAAENIGKFLGVFKDKGENPKPSAIPDGKLTNDPVEYSRIYQEIMKGG